MSITFFEDEFPDGEREKIIKGAKNLGIILRREFYNNNLRMNFHEVYEYLTNKGYKTTEASVKRSLTVLEKYDGVLSKSGYEPWKNASCCRYFYNHKADEHGQTNLF